MNTGQIIKSKLDRGYTKISNKLLQSIDLSMDARALCSYLLSLPADWVIYKTELPNRFKEGKHRVFNAFDELITAGYIVSVAKFNGNLKAGYDYVVYDEPVIENELEISNPRTSDGRLSEPRLSEDPQLQKKHSTKKTRTNKTLIDGEGFERFYTQYPRREGRLKAEEAWGRLTDAERLMAIQTVSLYALTVVGKEKGFIAHPTTWLNQKRFNDEYEQPKVTYKFPNGFKPPETTNANEFFGT